MIDARVGIAEHELALGIGPTAGPEGRGARLAIGFTLIVATRDHRHPSDGSSGLWDAARLLSGRRQRGKHGTPANRAEGDECEFDAGYVHTLDLDAQERRSG